MHKKKFQLLFTLIGISLMFPFLAAGQGTSPKVEPTSSQAVRQAHPDFEEISAEMINQAFEKLADHPRLLLTNSQMVQVERKIKEDPRWNAFYLALKARGDSLLKVSPLERTMEGRRLLAVSREALHRIFTLSFLYRYTKDAVYQQRAEQEMLALADFSDWNTSHFLDTAEMTMALAIGYDALYEELSPESRAKIKAAILDKGVRTSFEKKNQSWLRNQANWNQVCHGGMAYGVLAVAEEEPQLAREIVQRSVNGVTWSMASYEPDGNYTEGPGYWGYGTSFNVMLVAGLESALGTDFGRSNANGFLLSINYYEHVFGTTREAYNYPDSGGGKMFEPTAFWFTKKLKNPSITWNEHQLLQKGYAASINKQYVRPTLSDMVRHRLAVTALLWGPSLPATSEADALQAMATLKPPKELGYVGIGNEQCPVVLLRTSWIDTNAAYLGIKAGTPRSPHGHMDAGGFVYDNLGVRWAVELGPESYNTIEQMGMNLWSASQQSDRWKIFRYNNLSHNTLTINKALQNASETAKFIKTEIGSSGKNSSTVIDLTPVYKGEVQSAIRKATLLAEGSLVVEDALQALSDKDAAVQWRMLTPATVEITSKTTARLTLADPNDSKKTVSMVLKAESQLPVTIIVEPAATDKPYDAPNKGISVIILSFDLKAGASETFKVTMSK